MEFLKTGFPEPTEVYLEPTPYFDYDKPAVAEFAANAIAGAKTAKEKAIKAFYAVRDAIRYDPYRITDQAGAYKASDVLKVGAAYCIPKASLLTAVTRAAGIPTAIGLSDVTNHMCTDRMREAMGGKDLFLHHGYAVMLIDGNWVKAAPAFNIELCDKFDVTPTEFDGVEDALLQEFDKKGRRHMEYVATHGIWSDLPFDRVYADFNEYYGPELWDRCRKAVEQNEQKQARNFEDEKPVT
ncbi:MAG: transglutaminase family protein [Pseudomonadota bacterium]|nr:transglutaminase family protein [Pseudomonadota bacterium]MEC7942721.1 transglutaminase family protein [Pseudomonadota bacterium]